LTSQPYHCSLPCMESAPANAPGTPTWVDLGSPDPKASANFYGQLFGWQAEDLGPEAMNYTIFRQNGKQVAAVGGLMSPQQPPAWSTYIGTTDADATAKKVTEAGGQVIAPPFDVMDAGRMAVFADASGAVFSVWQPGKHKGVELSNQPNSLAWNELSTRDMAKAKDFYGKVFGWGAKTNQAPGMEYTEWQIDGRSMAGGMPMGENFPPNAPPFWLVYFAVEDPDATGEKATQLGGRVMQPAFDTPAGRMAVITDPQGAAFAVIKLKPM
jgi:predicted enzyme related to lactoylglutathione lyase